MSAGKILVVDDDPQIRRVMKATLTGHGYEVIDVRTGEEAMESIAREIPNLVLLDMNMPGMEMGPVKAPAAPEKTAVPPPVAPAPVQTPPPVPAMPMVSSTLWWTASSEMSRDSRALAATPSLSRMRPSKMCSVPIKLWLSNRASS